jgi:hypothetical protein
MDVAQFARLTTASCSQQVTDLVQDDVQKWMSPRRES